MLKYSENLSSRRYFIDLPSKERIEVIFIPSNSRNDL